MQLVCLVDDEIKPHSSFRKEHGLAILVASPEGQVLFDTGRSSQTLFHNLDQAAVDPKDIAAVVLSHGHQDHTGGLPALLDRRPDLPVYAHPGLLQGRYSRRKGKMKEVGAPITWDDLAERADLFLSDAPQTVLPGIFTTGEIRARPEPEGRSDRHFVRIGEGWAPDPYADDMAMVVDGPNGLVLICGCCHAGLLNTLLHVREVFGRDPSVVVGGTHLISADKDHLDRLIAILEPMDRLTLHLNHCTGQSAYMDLAFALGERVAPFPAGASLTL